jgi:hypothetical protein
LGFGDLLDFGQNNSGFFFERILHQLVVAFGVFSGAMLELEIAKIIVNRIAAFKELVKLSAVRSKVGGVRVNVKDEEENGNG